jgi:hypothetical protein
MTEEGYRKVTVPFDIVRGSILINHAQYRGGFYRISYRGHWTVVCCNMKLISELRKAGEDEFSFLDAIAEVMDNFAVGCEGWLDHGFRASKTSLQ